MMLLLLIMCRLVCICMCLCFLIGRLVFLIIGLVMMFVV